MLANNIIIQWRFSIPLKASYLLLREGYGG